MKNTYICNQYFKVCKLIAAMVMLAAVTVTSCNTTVNTVPEQYPVAFSENGGVGTLTATVDGKPITLPEVVQKDKTIVFAIAPAEGYEVEKWTVNGTVVPGNTANTYSHKVTAKLAVKVSLKAIPAFTVRWNAFGHGTLTATVDGTPLTPGALVFRDKTVVFTAESEADYTIGKWAVSGGSFAESTGTEGNSSATVTITANTRVDIQFNPREGLYHKIDYGTDGQALKDYLNSLLNGVSYIEITGLTKDMLQGNFSEGSPLGKIITQGKRNVALKFGDAEIAGLTSMEYSFKGCTKLVEVSNIPASVTDMERCFYSCANLKQAPVIPASVTNMDHCFSGCVNLKQAPVIPENVTDMEYCFGECEALMQARDIPASVTNMEGCFINCVNLKQAPVIFASVTNMKKCFSGCTKLEQAPVIPASVTNMDHCFSRCTKLEQAPIIPEDVTDMEYCFVDCGALTQVPVIPASVMNMKGCFAGCKKLEQVPAIPENVTNMEYCFSYCNKLTAVTLKCAYNQNFNDTFLSCTGLQAGSITVLAHELTEYQTNAGRMGVAADRFKAE